MTTKTKITQPTKYRDFVLVPKANGIDFIDPTTGRWMHFASQRYAKWSATFMSNITSRMNANAPMRNIPQAQT